MAECIPSPTDWVRETDGTIRGQRRLGRNYPPRDWAVCHHRDEPWEPDGSDPHDASDAGEGREQLCVGRSPRCPRREPRVGAQLSVRRQRATPARGRGIHNARPRGRQCRPSGRGCGTWQWQRFHPTQSIVTGQRGGFLCSLQSRRDQTLP